MSIKDHIKEQSLHHAYLIEGNFEDIMPEILESMEELDIETKGNPDFSQILLDSLKIDDARNLKVLTIEKATNEKKRIFIISANSILLEAQNSLLKMFEEPIPNTHFFLILPDMGGLLPTFTSRFYKIPRSTNGKDLNNEAEKFIKMPLTKRIDFIKELTTTKEDADNSRPKALKFLNSLESVMHKRLTMNADINIFNQIFTVRIYLRQPGSSVKSLMESVALLLPVL